MYFKKVFFEATKLCQFNCHVKNDEIFQNSCPENSLGTKSTTGFYMMGTLVTKGLNETFNSAKIIQ